MEMDWEAEWGDLGNRPWATGAHLSGCTQKAVQDFRKWWNRYLPSLVLCRTRSLIFYFRDSTWRYYPNVSNEHLQMHSN